MSLGSVPYLYSIQLKGQVTGVVRYLLLIIETQLRSWCVGFQEEVPGVWTIGRRLAGGVVAGAGGGGGVVVLLLSTTTGAKGQVYKGWEGGIIYYYGR